MPSPNPTEIAYDFDYGETHLYHVFPARDIELRAKNIPGIYAWYARVLGSASTQDDLAFYSNVYSAKQFGIQASAHLGETYEGVAKRRPAFGGTPPAFAQMIATASTVFSPPIYIGISKDVKTRLQTHLRSLETTLANVSSASADDTQLNDDDADTDNESKVFGERIGKILREQKIKDTGCLFLKVIYQHPHDRVELRATEHFVNRIFTPVCGRR